MHGMAEGTEIDAIDSSSLAVLEIEEGGSSSSRLLSSPDSDDPTEEEKATLRLVSDTLPWSAFLVAVIELCERFTYYGISGPFQNYIQNDYHDPSGLPGALGTPASSLPFFLPQHLGSLT